MTQRPKPLPDRTDPEHAAFWDGTDRGELRVKRCNACAAYHWPPRLGCPHCGSDRVEWTTTSPRGTLYSWTVVHRSLTPGFETLLPYAVVLVALDDAPGVRMIGNLADGPIDRLAAGRAMHGVFTPSEDGSVTLVNWQFTDPEA